MHGMLRKDVIIFTDEDMYVIHKAESFLLMQ